MAYRITYGAMSFRKRLKQIRGTKQFYRIKYALLTAVATVSVLLGRFGVFDFLIPGDKEVTTTAFYNMIDDIGNGETIVEAFTTFCEVIVEEAQCK